MRTREEFHPLRGCRRKASGGPRRPSLRTVPGRRAGPSRCRPGHPRGAQPQRQRPLRSGSRHARPTTFSDTTAASAALSPWEHEGAADSKEVHHPADPRDRLGYTPHIEHRILVSASWMNCRKRVTTPSAARGRAVRGERAASSADRAPARRVAVGTSATGTGCVPGTFSVVIAAVTAPTPLANSADRDGRVSKNAPSPKPGPRAAEP